MRCSVAYHQFLIVGKYKIYCLQSTWYLFAMDERRAMEIVNEWICNMDKDASEWINVYLYRLRDDATKYGWRMCNLHLGLCQA